MRRRPTTSWASLAAVDSLTVDGPSAAAMELMAQLGQSHGRRQKRWRPTEEMVLRLAALATSRATVRSSREEAGNRAAVARLQGEARRLETRLEAEAGESLLTRSTPFEELLGRRRQQRAAQTRGELDVAHSELDRLVTAGVGADARVLDEIAGLQRAAQVLWSVYRVEYVQALAGPADAQRLGPSIPPVELSVMPIVRGGSPSGEGEQDES